MIGRSRAAWALLPLLFFCGSAMAAGASWPELLQKAEKLSNKGRYDESVKAAEDALADAEKSLPPENPAVVHILARLIRFYESVGDFSRLPEVEKRLSAIKSKDFEVWSALGQLRRDEGRSREAEDALKNALAFKPDDPEAESELALVYDDMGRFEEAAALLKKAIEKEPQGYALYSQLARAYTRLGRFAQAKEVYAQANKIDGNAADAYIEEGYFYLGTGHPVQAKEAFENAIAVDTANPDGYHHMGFYLSTRQQYPAAEKYFRQALEKLEASPNTALDDLLHTMFRLGLVIEAQGRYDDAEAVYRKGLEKARPGSDRQLWFLQSLAKLYVVERKSAQAEAAYKRAVAECSVRFKCRFTYAGGALLDLGQFYLSQGRRTEAEAMAARAEALGEDVPIGLQFDVLRDLAGFYARLGDASKEAALYARLMPLRRTMPFNYDLVWLETGSGNIAAAQGRLHEAEDLYHQAIGVMDHNGRWKEEADALDRLAALDEKDAKHHEAAEASERAKSLRTRP